jgi:hypothetical protein
VRRSCNGIGLILAFPHADIGQHSVQGTLADLITDVVRKLDELR